MKRNRVQIAAAKRAEGAGTLQGTFLRPPAPAKERFQASLDRLIDEMTRTTEREMRKLQTQFPTGDSATGMDGPTLAAQARILTNALRKRFFAAFSKRARAMAEKLAKDVAGSSKSQMHASLRELSGGVSLKTSVITPQIRQVVAAGVVQNVELIKSIPEQYFLRIQGSIMRNIQQGEGTAGILRTVEEAGGVTRRRARIIARDQTSKATTALNVARFKALGVKKFRWQHSGGGKEPRKLHIAMSGKIYDMDKPPVIDERTGERGFPGQAINCRCAMAPVVEFDEG